MDLTTDVLSRALNAVSLRQLVSAHNLSNLNTPNYKRLYVSFEEALRTAADPRQVEPLVQRDDTTTARADGNNVDLEREMTLLAENQLQHAALVRQVDDHLNRIRLAIFEGRR